MTVQTMTGYLAATFSFSVLGWRWTERFFFLKTAMEASISPPPQPLTSNTSKANTFLKTLVYKGFQHSGDQI